MGVRVEVREGESVESALKRLKVLSSRNQKKKWGWQSGRFVPPTEIRRALDYRRRRRAFWGQIGPWGKRVPEPLRGVLLPAR